MKKEYPIFLKEKGTLTVISSPTYAYQYRDTDTAECKANGFEFYQLTNRKTIRKLQHGSTIICQAEFIYCINEYFNNKLQICFDEVGISAESINK